MRYKTAMVVMAVWLVAPGAALAQNVIGGTEDLEFDRPESWGMKFFASLSLLTSMGVPERMGAGTIDLGFEGGFVPQLSEEQRRIGFNGTKLENLNRSRFFGRVRGHIGLSTRRRKGIRNLGFQRIPGFSSASFAPLRFKRFQVYLARRRLDGVDQNGVGRLCLDLTAGTSKMGLPPKEAGDLAKERALLCVFLEMTLHPVNFPRLVAVTVIATHGFHFQGRKVEER